MLKLPDTINQLMPPPRFKDCRFRTFNENPEFPSQKKSIRQIQNVVHRLSKYNTANPIRQYFLRKRNKIRGLYLDGPFGVGKTHLLTSAFHEFGGNKVYTTFSDLMYMISYFGTEQLIKNLETVKLLCLDEFELDDPGNTMKARRFISEIVKLDTFIITTSNTIPGELGQGRFSAKSFTTEIGEISGFFKTIHVEGEDYRYINTHFVEDDKLKGMFIDTKEERLSFPNLNILLANTPQIEILELLRERTIWNVQLTSFIRQDIALRFCYFIDKVYDYAVPFRFERDTSEQLFPDEFINGVYGKKYKRCLSRLNEISNYL